MAELSILFYRRKASSDTKYTSIYCRITIDGKRDDFATAAKASDKVWDQEKQRVSGSGEMSRMANNRLSKLEADIHRIFSDLQKSTTVILPEMITYELKGGDKSNSKYSILSLFEDERKRMIADERSNATITSLDTALSAITLFIKEEFKQDDYPIHMVNLAFLNKFKEWAKKVRVGKKKGYKNNSFITIVQPLKRILERCHGLGIIKINPYLEFKLKATPSVNKFLNTKEVAILENIALSAEVVVTERYKGRIIKHTLETREITRDLFIFSCYTGISYIDLKNLSRINIVDDPEMGVCLSYIRQKSKKTAFTPLLKKPLEILNKYLLRGTDPIFPVEANYMYNERLYLLEKESGLGKKLNPHAGRHTTATFFLNNKVPVPIICAAIAISPEQLMRTYGKVLEETVSEHFKTLDASMK